MQGGAERRITHVIVATRLQHTRIEPRVENLPVGIAFVISDSSSHRIEMLRVSEGVKNLLR